MTIFDAVVELILLAVFLAVISVICITCRISLEASLMALFAAGMSYGITVIGRSASSSFTDKHLGK